MLTMSGIGTISDIDLVGLYISHTSISDLEVDLTIQERDIANVADRQRCAVMPEAFRSHEPFLKLHPNGYEGEVSRLMPIADRSKGTISVRVRVEVPREEEGVYLRPEGAALVSFLRSEQDQPRQFWRGKF